VNEQLLRQQKEQGFPWLRFAQPLETQYREECARLVRLRARPVAICALILFAAYAGLDWLLLPSSLSLQTMLVRLVLVCPLALAVLVLSYSRMPPVLFERFYAAAYLLGGLAIVLIIFLARRQDVAIPYDGLAPDAHVRLFRHGTAIPDGIRALGDHGRQLPGDGVALAVAGSGVQL